MHACMHELTYKNSQTTKIPTQGVECAKFACAELGARQRGAIKACVKAYELSRIALVPLVIVDLQNCSLQAFWFSFLKLLCVHLGLDVGVGQRRSSGQDSSDTVAMASHFQQEMHLGTVYFPLLWHAMTFVEPFGWGMACDWGCCSSF